MKVSALSYVSPIFSLGEMLFSIVLFHISYKTFKNFWFHEVEKRDTAPNFNKLPSDERFVALVALLVAYVY